jgi:cysteine desulfurase
MAIKDIAVSSGSACTSASLEPSYVLRALGAEEEAAHSSIRFGIGRFTTEEEVDFVVEKVVESVNRSSFFLTFFFSICSASSPLAPELVHRALTHSLHAGLRDLSPLWEMLQDGVDLKSIDWSQVTSFRSPLPMDGF